MHAAHGTHCAFRLQNQCVDQARAKRGRSWALGVERSSSETKSPSTITPTMTRHFGSCHHRPYFPRSCSQHDFPGRLGQSSLLTRRLTPLNYLSKQSSNLHLISHLALSLTGQCARYSIDSNLRSYSLQFILRSVQVLSLDSITGGSERKP